MSLNKNKQETVDKLLGILTQELTKIEQDTSKTSMQRLMEMQVVLDTTRFLENYQQNVDILNSYLAEHRWDIKRQQVQRDDSHIFTKDNER